VPLNLVTVLRKIDSLLQLEAIHGEAIKRLTAEVAQLKDRMNRLEARDEVLLARAEGASAAAATVAAAQAMSDLARRLGAMEERTRSLPPPR